MKEKKNKRKGIVNHTVQASGTVSVKRRNGNHQLERVSRMDGWVLFINLAK